MSRMIDQFPDVDIRHEIRVSVISRIVLGACVVLLLLATWAMQGCSTIHMQTPDGYAATYTRFGDQSIQGFRLERDNLGVIRVVLEKQSSDARILDAIGALVGAAK